MTLKKNAYNNFFDDSIIELRATSVLPIEKFGFFEINVFYSPLDEKEHVALVMKGDNLETPVVRVHSSCVTGDIFGSQRCDCGKQLDFALSEISKHGGVLIYLNQEGRGIGLSEKIKSYALQTQGVDTYHANIALGFEPDLRDYRIAAEILNFFHMKKIKLITNNPDKISQLEQYKIEVERIPSPVYLNVHNQKYLKTKAELFGHFCAIGKKGST